MMCEIKEYMRGTASRRKEREMVLRITLMLTVLLLASILPVGGQQGNSDSSQKGKPDQSGNPPARDIDLVIAPIAFSTVTNTYTATERYQAGDQILIQATLTNKMREKTDVNISIRNHFFQWRPRLVKDGKMVNFHKGMPEKLDKIDKDEPVIGSMATYRLEPGIPQRVWALRLSDWYGPLEPGRYSLTLWHRFWGKEKPAKSNTVTFEIVP